MSYNPISKAVADMWRRVPHEILKAVFAPAYNQWRTVASSVDDQIVSVVIRPRVLTDCDLVGGQEVWIRLDGVRYERTPEMMSVIYIPKDKTQGRSISQVLHLGYVDYMAVNQQTANGMFNPCSVTPLTTAVQAMNASYDVTGLIGTSRIELIGENVVLIKDPSMSPTNGVLRCILANDENMNNLSIRSYHAFTKLCELAVKSHIYNRLVIEMDSGRIQGGFELGAFKQIVDSYADAETEYQDYLRLKWQKIARMNDRETYERTIREQTGGFR